MAETRHWRSMLSLLAFGLLSSAAAARSSCDVHHVRIDASSLAYEECGHGPVVLIHPGGPGLDARYMLDFAQMVASLGYRAILIEPRGTGRSIGAIGDGSRLSLTGSVADLEALRRAIGVDRVTIVGHSFGSAIVQAYAATHPENVARLILLDPVGPTLGDAPQPLDGWRKQLRPAELADYDADRAKGDRIGAMRIKFVGSFHHRAKGLAFVRALGPITIDPAIYRMSQDYAANYRIAGPQTAFSVAIMSGEMDWIRGYEPALMATYPQARRYLVPHAGHFPWIDSPAETRASLRKALAG